MRKLIIIINLITLLIFNKTIQSVTGNNKKEYELNEFYIQEALTEEEIKFSSEPFSKEEFEKVLVYMASQGVYDYTIEYSTKGISELKSVSFKENVAESFKTVFSKYPEYFSLTNKLSYQIEGTENQSSITLRLTNPNFTIEEVSKMREIFLEEVTNEVINIIKEKNITKEMSKTEKAKILYDWVIMNTVYDSSFDNTSYTGYGQIVNKKAVCQGYTATYNYMCKLLGLEVQGISGQAGENHIWTLANFDGVKVHIDTTWGDLNNPAEPDYSYFGATSEYMNKTHTWNSDMFGL